jgi:hypothetical protein
MDATMRRVTSVNIAEPSVTCEDSGEEVGPINRWRFVASFENIIAPSVLAM